MKKISLFIAALVLLVFSSPRLAMAYTVQIVATNIESSQLELTWDGVNNDACEHAVACDPGDSLSYVLDVNTLEQRDVLAFYDIGYNVGIIDWTTPLEVGHTYKVQMHGAGDTYRITQEFVYTGATATNFTTGTASVNQLAISDNTNVTLNIFSPSLPAVDNNCLLNGASDLSVDIYVNGTNRQTVTGNCTIITPRLPVMSFSTNSLFGDGSYYFVVHSASTGNVWTSNPINYTTPPFTVSHVTLNHTTGHYSFDYAGYHGGDITGESVAIHADGDSWGFNHEPATCTGGNTTSGNCSGTFNYSQGTFSCFTAVKVQVYGYHGVETVDHLANPDPSCVATPHEVFPNAAQGIVDNILRNDSNDFQANLTLPGYYQDCWNDDGFTATVYDAATNQPVATMVNTNQRHLCGFLDVFDHSHTWTVYPDVFPPSGTYWVYAHSNNNGNASWVTGYFYYAAPTSANQAPSVTFTAGATTVNEGDTFTAAGSFTDPDSTAWTATVDYGDGSGVQPLALNPDHTFNLSHAYVDNGSYTITVSVTDNGGLTGASTGSGGGVVVNNPAPTIPPITPPTNVNQSGPAVINVNFSDYGNQTHTATVNWGDGSGDQSVSVSGNDFSSGHAYQNPGTYMVTVIVTDSEGATTTQTLAITVLNVAPQVGTISFPGSVGVGASHALSVNFTDPGTVDTHTATINWGDGHTTNGVVSEANGSGTVTGNHAYAVPGNYTVTVAVTDDDNGTGQSTANTTAVNQVTALSPAGIWIGLKNSDDVGTKFDLKVEAFKGGTLIASGQLDSFAGGSSGFNNAHLATIPFSSFAPVDVPAGSVVNVTVSVRNACVGSGHNSGVARLWYNDSAANSKFGLSLNAASTNYYLRDAFGLSPTAGPGPQKTIDVQAGAKCSAFKPFGTWAVTL